MNKMSEDLAIRILSGDVIGTSNQEQEAVEMGIDGFPLNKREGRDSSALQEVNEIQNHLSLTHRKSLELFIE